MEQMPVEILSEIFRLLPVRDWVACWRVSRHWRQEALRLECIQSRGWKDYKHFKHSRFMICQACGWNRALIRPTTGLRECMSCRKDPKRALITKTRAMKDFKMKATDFGGIPCVTLANPYNSQANMYLYRVYDLLK